MKMYDESTYPQHSETRTIIGICMEVYNELGRGLQGIVYKDAIEYDFKQKAIPYQ